jgi:predicted transporter
MKKLTPTVAFFIATLYWFYSLICLFIQTYRQHVAELQINFNELGSLIVLHLCLIAAGIYFGVAYKNNDVY